MPEAWFRCYEELNDHLPRERRKTDFPHAFPEGARLAEALEELGIPLAEVDLVLVDGEPAGFDKILNGGERVSVYPVFESLDISPVQRLRPVPLREVRFVADAHLGKLAAYLRLLGFDTLYDPAWDDPYLARLSAGEGRILLTRDRRLLACPSVTRGLEVRALQPRRQVEEVLRRLDLYAQARPFTRCLRCNGRVRRVSRESVLHRLPPGFREAWTCTGCDRVYWKGSHYRRMAHFAGQVLKMTLAERIAEDLKRAMKARDTLRLEVLRMIKTALRNQEVAAGCLDEEQSVQVLMQLCKQRRDSIEQFEKAGRADRAEAERRELAIVEEYLPPAPTDEEMSRAVEAVVVELGASTMKHMGAVMKEVKARFSGRPVDGRRLSEIVRDRLGG